MSPRTVATYRDAFMLLLQFVQARYAKSPATVKLTDLTPELILGFLDHLEQERHNAVRSRNARLAALRAFLKFAAHRDVSSLHVIERALGVPMKRFERPMLKFLSPEQMQAVIGEPGDSWLSRRDHLLLGLLYNTGARVSEIIGVRVADVVLDGAACVHLLGKGRKHRSMPLWRSTVKEARAWLKLNPQLGASSALLPNRDGEAMTRWNVRQRLHWLCARRPLRTPDLTQAAHLASHDPPLDRDAFVAVRLGHRVGRAVAWARESDNYASLYRGRPRDEGSRARPAAGAKDKNASLSCFGLSARVPEVPVIMCSGGLRRQHECQAADAPMHITGQCT